MQRQFLEDYLHTEVKVRRSIRQNQLKVEY